MRGPGPCSSLAFGGLGPCCAGKESLFRMSKQQYLRKPPISSPVCLAKFHPATFCRIRGSRGKGIGGYTACLYRSARFMALSLPFSMTTAIICDREVKQTCISFIRQPIVGRCRDRATAETRHVQPQLAKAIRPPSHRISRFGLRVLEVEWKTEAEWTRTDLRRDDREGAVSRQKQGRRGVRAELEHRRRILSGKLESRRIPTLQRACRFWPPRMQVKMGGEATTSEDSLLPSV